MSDVVNELRSSADPLENDLARVYEHWQEVKRHRGQSASLGYEPRDINALGAVSVIASRVLNASAGFEEVDPTLSYEAIVLRYPERFSGDVIAAARKRLALGADTLKEFREQDIQFFIKSSAIELFGKPGVKATRENWVGQSAQLPELHRENAYAEKSLMAGFLALIWLHEQEKEGERGRGLTAVVQFGPLQSDQRAEILDAFFFDRPIGKDLLDAHKADGSFIANIGASRHSRIWPIATSDVDMFLSAVRNKIHKIADIEKRSPDPHDAKNLERIEDVTALRQVVMRRNQATFRQALLSERPQRCAISGTEELSVLEAAHIIPYSEKLADRDRLGNGLLLRSDIHRLFDLHLISIDPATRTVVVSEQIQSAEYQGLRGKSVPDDVFVKSLKFHFENYQKIESVRH